MRDWPRGGGPHLRRDSARRLALSLLVLSCEHTETTPWVGTQDCTVGIVPEQSPAVQVPPISISLSQTEFVLTGDAFYLENFSIGPVGDFYCEPLPFLVTAHPTQRDLTQVPEARPVLARAIALDPFECRNTSDGRIYTLTGTGQMDLHSAFINMTFSAWIGQEQVTLTCATRFVQPAAPDAGVAPAEGEPPTFETDVEGEQQEIPPFPGAEMLPDAGSASTPDMVGAG